MTAYHDLNAAPFKPSRVLQQWARTSGPAHRRATPIAKRAYAGAQMGRTLSDWIANSTSADSEIWSSLRTLRNRVRSLVRDNEYAGEAVKRIIPNNVIGEGIRLQPNVKLVNGNPDKRTNEAIKELWDLWGEAESCHTAGKWAWPDIERQVMQQVAESGEVLVRLVKESMGRSGVPLALEIIEADQLADNITGMADNGNEIRLGVEVNKWKRPVAYHFYPKHPGDMQFASTPVSNQLIRVPADEVLHIAVFERPLQTRGVPWLHSVIIKLRHMGGYEEAEIIAARASACIMGFITTPEPDGPALPEEGANDDGIESGERVFDMSPAVIQELGSGEQFTGFAPTRPNAALEPFMRFMLRAVASGIGLSYETLSRDFSNSNYSSARVALLNERDNWRVLQAWIIRALHQHVYRAFLDAAVMANKLNLPGFYLNPLRYERAIWHARGWQWVDPLKEIQASRIAVRSGLSTLTKELAQGGTDFNELVAERQRELETTRTAGIVLDTDVAAVNQTGTQQPQPSEPREPDGELLEPEKEEKP